VLHEGASPIGFVLRTSGELQRLWKRVVENDVEAREEFPQALHLIRQYSLKLAELFKMLTPLSVGKRGAPELFRPIEPIADAKAVFKSHKTRITVHGGVDAPQILGYSADLNTAMINLLINSVYWLEESATPDPRIDISLVVHGGELIILVEDNGPGVPAEFNSRIFDAGFSLKDGGTGLGLNIAREAIARSGGVLGFHVEHEHGALFEMRFDVGGKK
jgi:signal transduction histidine kinase